MKVKRNGGQVLSLERRPTKVVERIAEAMLDGVQGGRCTAVQVGRVSGCGRGQVQPQVTSGCGRRSSGIRFAAIGRNDCGRSLFSALFDTPWRGSHR